MYVPTNPHNGAHLVVHIPSQEDDALPQQVVKEINRGLRGGHNKEKGSEKGVHWSMAVPPLD
jgi:hypothetical protein